MLKGVLLLKYFLRFATVGVVNTLVGYAVIFLCMYGFDLSAIASNIIGYGVGLTTSFTLNRAYTFRSTAALGPQVFRFLVFFSLAYLVNLGVLIALIRYLSLGNGVAQVLAGAAYSIVFFLLSNYFVFLDHERRI